MAITYNEPLSYNIASYTYQGTDVSSVAINGIWGHSFDGGTEELIVAWNNHPVIYDSTLGWRHQSRVLTVDTDVFFESFLDHVFMVNYTDANTSYDGTTWSTTTNVTDSPIAQFVKEHKTRLYLYKIKIGDIETLPSHVWFSDLPKKGEIKWGLEYGTNLAQTAESAVVTSAASTFETNNIKIGDPFIITTGDNAGEYVVQSIDSETQITLTEALDSTASNSSFWVGGNYFEVATEDGDIGMGLAETSNELFCFKKNSLYRYNSVSKELRKVKTAPGTTSSRSIVESGGYIYWYHPSGIYRTQGSEEQLISNPIEDVISGMADSAEDNVVGWRNEIEKTVNMYLGGVTLRNGEVIPHCVVVFDENAETWSLKSYKTELKVACNWLETNVPKIYAGDSVRSVYQLDTGTDFDDEAISFELETGPIYPQGTEKTLNFESVNLCVENGLDIQVHYKLLYKPTAKHGVFSNDKDWKPMKGSQLGEKTEWRFPVGTRASGINLKIVESSEDESFLLEKLVLYYSNVKER